ncbi:MAG: PAS domain-containing protein [Candidatus Riflebacteria bacterium]|nr:PAS domain-containing protein [Candidatus Riflebacteria bacterium]
MKEITLSEFSEIISKIDFSKSSNEFIPQLLSGISGLIPSSITALVKIETMNITCSDKDKVALVEDTCKLLYKKFNSYTEKILITDPSQLFTDVIPDNISNKDSCCQKMFSENQINTIGYFPFKKNGSGIAALLIFCNIPQDLEKQINDIANSFLPYFFLTSRKENISEELQAKLDSSETKYQLLVDELEQKIFYKDPDSVYISCNRAYANVLGITPEEITGKTDLDFYPHELAEKYRSDDKLIMSGKKTRVLEEKYVEKGKEYWVYTTKTPIFDHTGKNLGILGMFYDITEKKLLEEQTKNLNQQLEIKVAERTAQLESINRELEAFCYSVSHDLRTPLRGIDGLSLALVEDFEEYLPSEAKDLLRRIRSGTQRMGQLIDDLLKLSRITRAGLEKKHFDLSKTVHEVITYLRDASPERDVQFIIRPSIKVFADPDLLRVVIENLLENSWKFTSRRKNALIEFGIIEKDGERIYFVQDNGVGFDMAYVGKLFGTFQRLHGINEFEGNGVGLATVQRIINRHGGRVWAEGTPSKGAAFYFTLA